MRDLPPLSKLPLPDPVPANPRAASEWRRGLPVNHPYFGLNVKRVRRALGVSREELAVAVGVGLQTIKNYETRRTEPQLSILIRLMAKLGVEDLGDLLKPHSR